jgi:N-acetylneuraminate lyase
MLIDGFKGVYPAAVSPKDDAGRFSAQRLEALVNHLYASDVHGLYMCGNTGEGYLLPVHARKEATEVAVEASKGRGKVVVHVGAPAEEDAVALAKHAAEAGADGISSLPPYVQGYTFDEVHAHYTRLAYASGLPLFVYYIPVITHREFSLAEMDRLLSIEGVAGLKFTNHNLYLMEGIMDGGRNPHVFNGHDEVFLAGMAMGAQAGIGTYYNIMPEHFVGIYEAALAGDYEKGRELQRDVNRLIRSAQTVRQNGAVHALLRWQGIECGDPILPARPLDDEEEKRLREELDKAGLTGTLKI